jgi:hypothetical protein
MAYQHIKGYSVPLMLKICIDLDIYTIVNKCPRAPR